jgi:tartrate dehydratase alpha subunit/fumarate hydratase class I-like protein
MDDLVKRLRAINRNYELARGVHVDIREAADRIEALEAQLAQARKEHEKEIYLPTDEECLRNEKVRALVEAAQKLHHAVCDDTGFAFCVRADSGKAYPWPALDIADELVRAAIAAMQEVEDDN